MKIYLTPFDALVDRIASLTLDCCEDNWLDESSGVGDGSTGRKNATDLLENR